MVEWLTHGWTLAAAALVVYLPGLVSGYLLRLRGLALVALAPVLTATSLAVVAIVLPMIGLPWTLVSVGLAAVIISLVAGLVGLLLPARTLRLHRGRGAWLVPTALSVGVLSSVVRLVLYIGDPDALSQSNDAVFHLNALRWVVDTGSASSLTLSSVIDAHGFYPAAWHALGSVILLMTGDSVAAVANALTLVVSAGVWTFSISWFTRVATRSALATAFAGAFASTLAAFPLMMAQWGVLYPYGLAVAVLPTALAVVVVAPRWWRGAGPVRGRAASISLSAILALAGIGAIALAQPAVLLIWGVLVVIWATFHGLARVRSTAPRARLAGLGVILAMWAGLVAVWYFLAGMSRPLWKPYTGKRDAIFEVVFNAHMGESAVWIISILMLAGLVLVVFNRHRRWLAAAWLALGALHIACASLASPWVRDYIVGPWYADPYRFATLAPIVAIPLAAYATARIVLFITRRAHERRAIVGTLASVAVLVVVATAVVVSLTAEPRSSTPRVFIPEYRADQSRYIADDSTFLTTDERAVLDDLAENVEPGAVVLGNPAAGAAFGYGLSGVDVRPRTWAAPRGVSAWPVISGRLNQAGVDPEVCEALRTYGNPTYVLDFGDSDPGPGRSERPGMTGFDDVSAFELVDRQGDAALYRITACAE